jgi:hypothetical protein
MIEGRQLEFEQMLTLEPFTHETCQARGGSLAPNLPAWHIFSSRRPEIILRSPAKVISWAMYLCE